jgi:hypothetical protein
MTAMTLTKLKLKKEVFEEVEISLPHYCKNASAIYKIVDETTAIKVGTMPDYPELSFQSAKLAISLGHEQSDAEEFEQIYKNVLTYLNRKAEIL